MNQRLLAVVTAAFSLFTAQAFAGEQQILSVTSDATKSVLKVLVVTDGDFKVTGLKYVSPDETKVFALDQMPTGMVLMRMGGMDVVKLVSKNFDAKNGGPVSVIYLNNGLSGQYRTYPIEMDREGQSWKVLVNDRAGRRVITSAFMKTKRVLGKIVGIDQVIAN